MNGSMTLMGGMAQANRTHVSATSNAGSPADAMAQSITTGPFRVMITFSGWRSRCTRPIAEQRRDRNPRRGRDPVEAVVEIR